MKHDTTSARGIPELQATLNISDWDRLSDLYRIQQYDRPEVFIRKGEANTNLYFLLEGHAQVLIDEQNDIIKRIEAGEFIGELSFLDGLPTAAPVLAEDGCKIASISGDAVTALCATDPRFAERFYHYLALLLARRLRRTNTMVRELGLDFQQPPEPASHQKIELDDFEFRQLSGDDEVHAAMALLHAVYVVEQGWDPPDFNPSRVRVEASAGKQLLIDRFSSSAHWFGCFHRDVLVGCFRVLPYPRHELKEYRELPLFIAHSGASELNRLAFLPDYRRHKFAMLLLLRAAFDHAVTMGPVVYVTAPTPQPAMLFEKFGMHRASLPPFKYNTREAGEVDLLYFDCRTADRSQTPLYRLSDKLLSRGASNQSRA